MTDTSAPSQVEAPASNTPMIVVAILLVLGFVMLSMLGSGQTDRQLNKSAVGVETLGAWLDDQGVDNRLSHPRVHPSAEQLSLRILPLYDTDLSAYTATPETRDEQITQDDLRDILQRDYTLKVQEIRSIVLMPKWRGGLNVTGIAHEQSLIPIGNLQPLLPQLGLHSMRLRRSGPHFEQLSSHGAEIALFQAQFFDARTLPDTCKSVVTFGKDALVIACKQADDQPVVYIVSDPDLMNNHGLKVAENARFTVNFINNLRGTDERPVYIDRSSQLLVTVERPDEYQEYERGSDEFERFFTYPFSLLWAVLLMVLAMLFWRGSRRFGPLNASGGPSRAQSKRAAIAAKARLLRLSGNDGRMVADFVSSQIEDLAKRNFGHVTSGEAEARFMALVARRHPKLAKEFSAVSDTLMANPPEMSGHQRHRLLATYHSLLKKVMEHHGPH